MKKILSMTLMICSQLLADDKANMAMTVVNAALSAPVERSSISGKITLYDKKGIPKARVFSELALYKDKREVARFKSSHDGTFKLYKDLEATKYSLKVLNYNCTKELVIDLKKTRHTGLYFSCNEFFGYKNSHEFRSEILRKLDYLFTQTKKSKFKSLSFLPKKELIETWDLQFYTIATLLPNGPWIYYQAKHGNIKAASSKDLLPFLRDKKMFICGIANAYADKKSDIWCLNKKNEIFHLQNGI